MEALRMLGAISLAALSIAAAYAKSDLMTEQIKQEIIKVVRKNRTTETNQPPVAQRRQWHRSEEPERACQRLHPKGWEAR